MIVTATQDAQTEHGHTPLSRRVPHFLVSLLEIYIKFTFSDLYPGTVYGNVIMGHAKICLMDIG